MSMLVNSFWSAAPTFADGTNFPGQGSTNAGILAAVYFTYSGGSVTVVGQKNVASVVRNATGQWRITFTSTLGTANYGVLAAGRDADTANSKTVSVRPSPNTTNGWDTHSTTTLDICTLYQSGDSGVDVQFCAVIVFDPSAVGSDYLAAWMTTVSGTTPTLQLQTNVASTPRNSAGVHTINYTSAVANSDYSLFGTSRTTLFAGLQAPIYGRNRNSTSGKNRQSTSLLDLEYYGYWAGGSFDGSLFSGLIRNADTFPRGTVASARFSYIGGNISIIRSWNIASITRQSTGLYKATFTLPISDADYMLFACGAYPDAAGDGAPIIGMNANNGPPYNEHSVNACHFANNAGASDIEYADLWFVKPWLM